MNEQATVNGKHYTMYCHDNQLASEEVQRRVEYHLNHNSLDEKGRNAARKRIALEVHRELN